VGITESLARNNCTPFSVTMIITITLYIYVGVAHCCANAHADSVDYAMPVIHLSSSVTLHQDKSLDFTVRSLY
jgi:hypothetical protein